MKNGLEIRTLGEVFGVETGSTPSTAVADYWEGGRIKWITPLDLGRLNSPFIHETSRNITEKGLENSSATQVPAGSVIISTRAPIGYIAVLTQPMAFNQGCKALLPKDGRSVDPLYIYYQLKNKVDEMNRLGSGSTFKEISKEKLEGIEIQLPPLSIQKQIASILEKADAAREKRRQANELTEQFLQSAFLEMFGDPVTNPKGWNKVRLGEVTETITKGETPLWKGDSYLDSGILFLRSENVLIGLLDMSKKTFVSSEVHNRMKRSQVKKNDVLLNIVGASIGRSAVFEEDLEANINQAIAIIRPRSELSSKYLCFLLNSAGTQTKFKEIQAGVARDNLNLGQLRDLEIPLPPEDVQLAFDVLIKKVESLRAKQRESEKELDNLFNVLMQKAFKGELVSASS